MHPNEALIARLYEALDRHDGDAMAACYTADARFSDPVFPDLRDGRVRDMWRMLCLGAKDLKATATHIRADAHKGSAHLEADYTFTRTGRKVHNVIEARFVFRDGKIERHADEWDFKAWAAQALGLMGRLFGGMHQFRDKVRKDAAKRLTRFAGPGAPPPP
ncbi:MAG: hypothetical protein QOC71_384 [Thermoplasmata archaeon]|nr:hypothetical protein [Thermoplasmata archaeon]